MKHLKEMQILNQKRFLRGMAAKMTPYQDQKEKMVRQRERNFLIKGQGFSQQERKEFRLKSVSRPENENFSE